MKRNIKLLSTISVAAALAGSAIFVMNNNQEDNSTVQAASITLPSGYTKNVITYCEKEAHQLGFQTKRTNKGNLEIFVDGKDDYTVGFCAHVDTLGLMVRSIRNDGTLAFTNVGGPLVPTLDGEYCKIITREQQIYTGTILSNSPAVHVFKDAKSL